MRFPRPREFSAAHVKSLFHGYRTKLDDAPETIVTVPIDLLLCVLGGMRPASGRMAPDAGSRDDIDGAASLHAYEMIRGGLFGELYSGLL
jgi:hypothetical protein